MRVALCLSGQARTLDTCVATLREHITAKIDCDIFAYVAADADAHKVAALNATRSVVADDPVLDELDYGRQLGPGQHSGVQGILRQLYGVQRCNALKRQYEREHNFRYDWVIRARPDALFLTTIEDLCSADSGRISVPRHDNWAIDGRCGLNDRFAFGSSALMDIYADRIDSVPEYFRSGSLFHPETYLGAHLRRRGVPIARTHVVSALRRADGQVVQPAFYRRFADDVA